MYKSFFVAVIALAFCAGCVSSPSSFSEHGFVPLFDGRTLQGWKYVGTTPGYRVEDGTIVCPKETGGDLYTERMYSDFILRLEFKLAEGANNGVAFRSPAGGGRIAYIGNEIQLIDDAAPRHARIKPYQRCGAYYGIAAPERNAQKPAGEWNALEISAIGREVKVRINGQLVTDVDLNQVHDPAVIRAHPGMFRDHGHIGFLGHKAHTEFRNIYIREIPGPPARN